MPILPIVVTKTPRERFGDVAEYFITLGRVPARDPFLQVWLAFRGGWSWWLRFGYWRILDHPPGREWRIDVGPITVHYYGR